MATHFERAMTYEDVKRVCDALAGEGRKPSVRSITERIGGSNTKVLQHLRKWNEEQRARQVKPAHTLPIDIVASIGAALARAEEAARLEYKEQLEVAQTNLDDLVLENERLEARSAELVEDASTLRTQRDTLSGQLTEQASELQTLRTVVASERDAAEAARVESATHKLQAANSESRLAELRIRSDESEGLVMSLRQQLTAAQDGVAARDRQASVANAQLQAERDAHAVTQERITVLEAALEQQQGAAGRLAGAEATVVELRSTVDLLKAMLSKVEDKTSAAGSAISAQAPEASPSKARGKK